MATTFVEIDNRYYNSQTLGKAFTKEIVDSETGETTTLYYAQTLGGQDVEIDQQTYQDIIDGEYSPQGGGGTITVDSEISSTSENPVQNKVIYSALGDKQDTIDDSHKISADNVDDSSTTNKFVTANEKSEWDDKMSNPMTTGGDIIYGDVSGSPARLPIGTASQVLTVAQNGLALEWQTPSGGGGGTQLYTHSVRYGDNTPYNLVLIIDAYQYAYEGNEDIVSPIAAYYRLPASSLYNGDMVQCLIVFNVGGLSGLRYFNPDTGNWDTVDVRSFVSDTVNPIAQ